MGHEPVKWKTHSTIICKDCEQERSPIFSNGRPYARCQECLTARQRELRRKRDLEDPEGKRLRAKISDWKHHYGLTKEKYDELFHSQGGVCAICKQEPTGSGPSGTNLHVDHNHFTNEIRGLLCSKCNHAIGLLNEDQEIFLNAYEYLQRTTWNKGLELVQIRKKA